MDELTTKLAAYLGKAHDLALHGDNGQFGPEHVLAAMAEDGGSVLNSVARQCGMEAGELSGKLAGALAALPKVAENDGEVVPSRELAATLNLAKKDAARNQDSHVSSDSFLLACARRKGKSGGLLKGLGIDPAKVVEAVEKARSGERVTDAGHEEQRGALAKYPPDLTAAAAEGGLAGSSQRPRRSRQFPPASCVRLTRSQMARISLGSRSPSAQAT